jgi:4-hydroxybenzoyl-CoA reductase subunit alpha
VLAQIVAEEFGVALDDVRVVVQDTEVTPLDRGSFSSRVTLWTGNAVKAAAADAKEQLLHVISEKLEANPKDLVIRNRRIHVVGSPERGMPIDEAIKYCQLATEGRPIIGRGYYSMPFALPSLKTAIGNLSGAYSYGATVAEVEVDCRTGKVRVLNLTVAHDCGRAVNPLSVEGQLEGCGIMGVGTALSEGLVLEEGRSLNPSILDYKVPLIEDIPAIKNILIETIDPEGPFGAKEAGEGSIISVAPAIANAIYDAVGVRITGLPIVPEKVLRALRSAHHIAWQPE